MRILTAPVRSRNSTPPRRSTVLEVFPLLAPLLAGGLFAAIAWLAGDLLLRALLRDRGEESWALAGALGIAALGQLFYLIAWAGLFRRWLLLVLGLGILAAGLALWRRGRHPLAALPSRKSGLRVVILLLLPLPALLTLYPPTQWDEIAYHLPFARAIAAGGSLPFLPHLLVPVFPQLVEGLFAGLYLAAGELAPHFVGLAAAAATAALLAAWGGRWGGRPAALLAPAIFFGNPLVIHLATSGYIDLVVALFGVASLYALERHRDEERTAWVLLGGFLAGTAAAAKYLGLFFVAAGALFVLASRRRNHGRRDLGLFLLTALAALAPTYLRLVALTGNPVFPFFPELFGESLWGWSPDRWLEDHDLRDRLVGLVTLPWDITWNRGAVNQQPPISPTYLVGIPFLAWAAWRSAAARRLLAAAGGYLLAFAFLPREARYLTPILPLLSLVLAVPVARSVEALAPLLRLRRELGPTLLAALLVAPGPAYAAYRLLRQGPIPTTASERERYLAQELPLYPAIRFLNQTRGASYIVYGFEANQMAYYAEGQLLGRWSGPYAYPRMADLAHRPRALHRALAELEATHLLVNRASPLLVWPDTPRHRALFRRVYSDAWATVFELVPEAAGRVDAERLRQGK